MKIVKKAKSTGSLKVQVKKRASGELLSLLSSDISPDEKPGTSEASNLMPAPEEPPYFLEKWPGKVCILCNLGERSQLGQGEMLRMDASEDDTTTDSNKASLIDDKSDSMSVDSDKSGSGLTSGVLASNKRQKGVNKCKTPAANAEYVDELDRIGSIEINDFASLTDSGYYYIHRSCAEWSHDVKHEANDSLSNIIPTVVQALKTKCSYCSRYGASLTCKMSCPKIFHFPCVAASSGFQVKQTFTSFCKEHLGQVPLVCSEDINCGECSGLGDVRNLMMCSKCGAHYHGYHDGVAQLPGKNVVFSSISKNF